MEVSIQSLIAAEKPPVTERFMSQSGESIATLLFADVVKSTQGHQTLGEPYGLAIAHMHRTSRDAGEAHGSDLHKQTGDGFMISFANPMSAVLCARDIQALLLTDSWPPELPRLSVRMGLHTDEKRIVDGELTWPLSWRANRIMDAANGAQILISEATHALVKHAITVEHGLSCRSLGSFRLKDLLVPEPLFRLDVTGLRLSKAAPRALPDGFHNFPVEERHFIGREAEVAHVLRLFRDNHAQLVTISGIGGLGKTRLAKHSAAQMVEDFPDGVWLVEMEALSQRDEIVPAICSVISVDTAHETPLEGLKGFLVDRKLLLVLDCFERLAGNADLLDSILRFAPGVRFLITTRKVLRLPREFEYELQPMQFGDAVSGRRQASESMSLFAEAATHVAPDFAIGARNKKSVQEICALLEGLPLALILAASQLRYLSIADLHSELKASRFDVLVRPAVVVETRHEGLQQVITDSFRLLSLEEQSLLCELSVFVGGFYLEDARQVCSSAPTLPLLQGLSQLRDNSLLKAQIMGERSRYKLLDTVREYLDKMSGPTGSSSSGDMAACRRRHAGHYASLARKVHALIHDGKWKEGTDTLWQETGNVRAAIRFSIDEGLDDLVIAFAECLARTYSEAGLLSDFEILATAAEPASQRLGRSDIAAGLLGLRGALAMRRGDRKEAWRVWEDRVVLSLTIGDIDGAASTLFDLANMACDVEVYEKARILLARAMELSHGEGIPLYACAAQAALAEISMAQNDRGEARSQADQSRRMLPDVEDIDWLIFICIKLGRVYRYLDELITAEDVLRSAVRAASEGSRMFALSRSVELLGLVYEARGNHTGAATAFTAACRAVAVVDSRRSRQAKENLERFQTHGEDSVGLLLQELSTRTLDELTAQLLIDNSANSLS